MKYKLTVLISIVVLGVAGIFAFTWYKIDTNRQNQKATEAKQTQQVDLSSQARDNLDNTLLQTCLDNATNKYPWENVESDSKRDPVNSQRYTDLHYKIKSEEEESCKTRYPQ